MLEKDSNREAFLQLKERLQHSVEYFRSLKRENLRLRQRVEELEGQIQELAASDSPSQGEVARLLSERKQVRERVERILQAVSRLRSPA